jgi:hypothetical protein
MTTAICIASGPSLTPEDVEYCRGKGKVYVVNNTYKLAPWADVLYACDGRWWDMYHGEVESSGFKGEKWTIDFNASLKYGLKTVGVLSSAVWSNMQDAIATNGNSGFQVMNLAYLHAATKIILLGYDMKPRADGIRHWHGDHPHCLIQTSFHEYPRWIEKFKQASKLINIPVINCTADTALDCFPCVPLREAL